MAQALQEIWRVHADGAAPPALAALLEPERPVEELYDTEQDPHEIDNLATHPEHRATLHRLRAAYDRFAERVGWTKPP